MKRIITILMAACFLSFLTSVAGSTDQSEKEAAAGKKRIVQINLKASQFNAGALGSVSFVEAGESGEVLFNIAGLQPWISRPVHIYAYIYPGTCAKLGKEPAYEMNDTVIMSRVRGDAWKVAKKLPVALSNLLAGSYAVVVRSSPADGGRDLFCGDIR